MFKLDGNINNNVALSSQEIIFILSRIDKSCGGMKVDMIII